MSLKGERVVVLTLDRRHHIGYGVIAEEEVVVTCPKGHKTTTVLIRLDDGREVHGFDVWWIVGDKEAP